MCSYYDIAKGIVDAVRLGLAIKDSVETRQEAKQQTEIMRKQAKQKEQDAAIERQEGVEDARRKKLQAILNMGEEKTAIASGNISLYSATALNIVEDEKLNGELDALITLKDSEKRAENHIRQSQQYYEKAALSSYKSKNAFINSMGRPTGNVISIGNGYMADFKEGWTEKIKNDKKQPKK